MQWLLSIDISFYDLAVISGMALLAIGCSALRSYVMRRLHGGNRPCK